MVYIQHELDAEINKTIIVQKKKQLSKLSVSAQLYKSLLVVVNNPVNLNATTRGTVQPKIKKNKQKPTRTQKLRKQTGNGNYSR